MSDIIDYLNKPPQRYDHVFQKNSGSREMVEDPKGEFVKFDDMDLYMFEGGELMMQALARMTSLEAALDWALGNGVTACRGEVSGQYSFVMPGENSEDFDDIEPPTNLAEIIGEAALRCFARAKGVRDE